MLDDATCHALAGELDAARRSCQPIESLTARNPAIELADAYRVMRAGIGLRVARGEAVCGYKMGFTSQAKRSQMGLGDPIYGVLTEHMRVENTFRVSRCIHPRAEAEIAFVIGREIRDPVDRAEALECIAYVLAAIEILDSRYRDFKLFSLPDVVADNSSASHFAISEDARAPGGLDLRTLKMRLLFDGEPRAEAESSAISGDPVESLVQLSKMLCEEGEEIPVGSLILSGAATAAFPIAAGVTVRLEVTGLAPVSFRCLE
ncbi:MAG: 2-keto-4-pentenoate hydratase [Myxococcales bacterium]